MKDKIGREINVGDFIAYGRALGRCAGLSLGKVIKTLENGKVKIINEDGGKATLSFTSRMIVISSMYNPDFDDINGHGYGNDERKKINWDEFERR